MERVRWENILKSCELMVVILGIVTEEMKVVLFQLRI